MSWVRRALGGFGGALVAALLVACGTTHAAPPPEAPPAFTASVPSPAGPPPTATLTMMDVGTGLAVLVQGEDFSLLYDAGSNDDLASGANSRALAYLSILLGPSGPADCGVGRTEALPERTLDHVFLSHPHRDHLSMLPDILRCYAVRNVWEPGLEADSVAFKAFEDAATDEPGAVLHRADRAPHQFEIGTQIALGRGVHATVLSVRPTAKDPNDASIVLRLDVGAVRVLFMGDAGGGDRALPSHAPSRSSVEAELLAKHRKALRADVLVVGHHGSMTSSRDAFLDAVRPRFALVSSGPKPYGRVVLPDAEVIAALEAHSARVLRTDEDDGACRRAEAKVGPDVDGAPGGCSAVTLILGGKPSVVASPGPAHD